MNCLKTFKNRLSLFLNSFWLSRGFMACLYSVQRNRAARKVVNHAALSEEIFEIISSLGLNIFPFYGTLLFLIREGAITFADDFDFATMDTIDVEQLVLSLARKGAYPNGVVRDSSGKVYQINFVYKGCSIDLAVIKNEGAVFSHEFVHFRNERAKVTYANKSVLKEYSQIYRLTFPSFSLNYSSSLNALMPTQAEDILSTIYGEDWMTPKNSNFIDYKNYSFIDRELLVIKGSVNKYLPKLLND